MCLVRQPHYHIELKVPMVKWVKHCLSRHIRHGPYQKKILNLEWYIDFLHHGETICNASCVWRVAIDDLERERELSLIHI